MPKTEQYKFWSALIGDPEEYKQMLNDGWEPTSTTLTGVLLKKTLQDESECLNS